MTLAPHSFKHSTRIWNQRNTAQSPILCAGGCVSTHNNFARVKIKNRQAISRASLMRHPVNAKPDAKSAQLIESRLWPARISAINALNLSILGNLISLHRTGARFTAAAALL
jgi:hypothetical protein